MLTSQLLKKRSNWQSDMIQGNSCDVRHYERMAKQAIANTPEGEHPEYPWWGPSDTELARQVWQMVLCGSGKGGETYNKFDLRNKFEAIRSSHFTNQTWRKYVGSIIGCSGGEISKILHGNSRYIGCPKNDIVRALEKFINERYEIMTKEKI